MHHLAVVAVVPGSELAGGLMDVVLRELWKRMCYWRVYSVKANFQSTVPHTQTILGPTATGPETRKTRPLLPLLTGRYKRFALVKSKEAACCDAERKSLSDDTALTQLSAL